MLFVATIVLAFYDTVFLNPHHPIFIVFLLALFIVAVWQHRANIDRLRKGTELKLRGEREGAKPGGGS